MLGGRSLYDSFEAASCHNLTTGALKSRCYVPRQVTEAFSPSL